MGRFMDQFAEDAKSSFLLLNARISHGPQADIVKAHGGSGKQGVSLQLLLLLQDIWKKR